MKKYKYKKKAIFLLHMLLIACFLSVVPVSQIFAAGFETIKFTPDDECNLAEEVGNAIDDKWWETPLDSVLNASVAVGNTVFASVATGAEQLMFVGMGLWLALFTLKIVGGMQESDPLENLTKIGGMMLKVGIASALLHNRDFFFEYFIATVVQAGAGFVDTGDIAGRVGATVAPPDIQMSGGGLDSVAAALRSMADSIHDSIADAMGRANFLQCIGKIHQLSFPFGIGKIGPLQDPKIWASGCAIWFGALIFMFVFPFYLIDACFRLGVVAALCPLFIIAWVFPSTRDFAAKGWAALLNIAFTFMIIKIVMIISVQLLMGGSGLEDMKDDDNSKTLMVCIYRWGSIGGDDPCAGKELPETNSLWIYLVCVVYGIMLLKESGQIAGHFSGASFSNDTAFQAAKGAAGIAQRTARDGIALAGMAKDGVKNHRDRRAARRYEKDQRARETAQKGGPAYKPSPRDQRKLEKAKKRLIKAGALTPDGRENEAKMSHLLKNSKARKAMRLGERFKNFVTGTDTKKFESMSDTYVHRDKDQLQNLKSVGRNAKKGNNAESLADIASKNMAKRQYDNTPQGQNQRLYDQMTIDTLKKEAQYRDRCVKDSSYANSEAGKKEREMLIGDKKGLRDIKEQYGCDDNILDPNFIKNSSSNGGSGRTSDWEDLSSFK